MKALTSEIILATILLVLQFTANLSQALPGGAPRCKINQTVITNGITEEGHGPMSALGLTFSVASTTYTPGQMMAIQINNIPVFQRGGILAYVSQDSNPNAHVGQFMLQGALRAQTTAACNLLNVINDAPASTITHMMPLTSTNVATLMWTAPAANVGPVTINAVIATGTNEGFPWQIVPVMKLIPAAGAGPVAPAAPAAPSAPAAPTVPTMAPVQPPVMPPPQMTSAMAKPSTSATAPPKKTMTVFVPTDMEVVVQTMPGLKAPMAAGPVGAGDD